MARKTKQTKTKIKKKKWVPVIAPKIFNNVRLGDTHVVEDSQAEGKSITMNLMTVLNDMRKQNYAARFDIIEVKDGKAHTSLVGLMMAPSAVKRLIRRGRDKIDDSFLARLRTGQVVRVKPVVVTTNKCSKETQTAIRLDVREKLKEVLKGSTLDGFVKDVIERKIQRVLKNVSSKHHPTKSFDIRSIMLIPKAKENLKETQKLVDEDLALKAKEAADKRAARDARKREHEAKQKEDAVKKEPAAEKSKKDEGGDSPASEETARDKDDAQQTK